MNAVFPLVQIVAMSSAPPGSIVQIPRSDDPLIALVTNQVINNGARSFVILNSKFHGRPSVLFAENWRDEQHCLRYRDKPQFDLVTDFSAIDVLGNKWWDEAGVIIPIDDELYIRAAPPDAFSGGNQLVSIQTGALFARQLSSASWTFGAWQLFVKGTTADQRIPLANFDIRKRAQKV